MKANQWTIHRFEAAGFDEIEDLIDPVDQAQGSFWRDLAGGSLLAALMLGALAFVFLT
jgi:hypothetical protein